MSSSLAVRPAQVEDVAQMARVHVRSWPETYRGLMSDAILDDPGFLASRERLWTAALTDERYRENRVAVAERDGELVGIAMSGPPLAQLYSGRSQRWATRVAEQVGLPDAILPDLCNPGDTVGTLLPDVARQVGLYQAVPVIAVGSRDTASAVVGVPAGDRHFAYVSSGTWSLVGLELSEPVLTRGAREADFTNEAGVDNPIRFLKNVTGLGVLPECVRHWEQEGLADADLATVLSQAALLPAGRAVIEINDHHLLPPDGMPARVINLARGEADHKFAESLAEVTRVVLDSLTVAYRRCVRTASELAGVKPEVVHVVGGGSENELLCQLTADACELPVVAGPKEAPAPGNVLVQVRALGVRVDTLADMRPPLRHTHALERFEPDPTVDWARLEGRLEQVQPARPHVDTGSSRGTR